MNKLKYILPSLIIIGIVVIFSMFTLFKPMILTGDPTSPPAETASVTSSGIASISNSDADNTQYSLTNSNYSYYSKQVLTPKFKVYFRNNSNTAEPVRFEKDGYYFIYDISGSTMMWKATPTQPSASSTLGGGYTSNSKDTLIKSSGNKAVYGDAFSFTNVTYDVTGRMVKENFVLSNISSGIKDYLYLEYTGNIKFTNSLKICANNKCYTPSGNLDDFNTTGRIDFKNSTNATIFFLSAPVAIDSAGHKVNCTYVVHGSNAQMNFYLRIPTSFLRTAVYPIFIDPTVEIPVVYQSDRRIQYLFDWGETNLYLKKNGNNMNKIFVFSDRGKVKFGAKDYSKPKNELSNYTYIVNSTAELVLTWGENLTANYTYPVLYNYYPNGMNELRHYYNFEDICSKNYSQCNWTQPDSKSFILNFQALRDIDPTIVNATGCLTMQSNTDYYLNASINTSPAQNCFVATGKQNITFDGQGFTINQTGGNWIFLATGGTENIIIKNVNLIATTNGILMDASSITVGMQIINVTCTSGLANRCVQTTTGRITLIANSTFNGGSGLILDSYALSSISGNTFNTASGTAITMPSQCMTWSILNNTFNISAGATGLNMPYFSCWTPIINNTFIGNGRMIVFPMTVSGISPYNTGTGNYVNGKLVQFINTTDGANRVITPTEYPNSAALWIERCQNLTIRDFNFSGNIEGVVCGFVDNVTVVNNTFDVGDAYAFATMNLDAGKNKDVYLHDNLYYTNGYCSAIGMMIRPFFISGNLSITNETGIFNCTSGTANGGMYLQYISADTTIDNINFKHVGNVSGGNWFGYANGNFKLNMTNSYYDNFNTLNPTSGVGNNWYMDNITVTPTSGATRAFYFLGLTGTNYFKNLNSGVNAWQQLFWITDIQNVTVEDSTFSNSSVLDIVTSRSGTASCKNVSGGLSSCSQINDTSVCSSSFGCLISNCTGTLTGNCGQIPTQGGCDATAYGKCFWGGNCTGGITDCTLISDGTTCSSISGCSYSCGGSLTGTCADLTGYGQYQCDSETNGHCSWQNMHCDGTVSNCALIDEGATCSATGCTWSSCQGSITQCTDIADYTYCTASSPSCVWNSCTDNPALDCSIHNGNQATCDSLPKLCTWNSGASTCDNGGTSGSSCSALNGDADCQYYNGCQYNSGCSGTLDTPVTCESAFGEDNWACTNYAYVCSWQTTGYFCSGTASSDCAGISNQPSCDYNTGSQCWWTPDNCTDGGYNGALTSCMDLGLGTSCAYLSSCSVGCQNNPEPSPNPTDCSMFNNNPTSCGYSSECTYSPFCVDNGLSAYVGNSTNSGCRFVSGSEGACASVTGCSVNGAYYCADNLAITPPRCSSGGTVGACLSTSGKCSWDYGGMFNLNLINTTYNQSRVQVAPYQGSSISRYWHYQAKTIDTLGNNVTANVTAYNSSLATIFSVIANPFSGVQNLLEYISYSLTATGNNPPNYYSNIYTINASNSTSSTPNLSHTINISLGSNYSDVFVFTMTLPDTTPPTITLISPTDNTQDTDGTLEFMYLPADTSGIANCSFIYQSGTYSTATSITNSANNAFLFTNVQQNHPLWLDDLIWSVNCTDTLGNQGSSSTRHLDTKDTSILGSGGGQAVVQDGQSKLNPLYMELSYPKIWIREKEADVGVTVFNQNNQSYIPLNLTFSPIEGIEILSSRIVDNKIITKFRISSTALLGEQKLTFNVRDERELTSSIVINIDDGTFSSQVKSINSNITVLYTIIAIVLLLVVITFIVLLIMHDRRKKHKV